MPDRQSQFHSDAVTQRMIRMIRIHPVFGESERNMPAAIQQSFRTDRAAMTDQTGEIILKTMGYIPQSEAGPAVDGIHGVIRRTPGNGGMSDGFRFQQTHSVHFRIQRSIMPGNGTGGHDSVE